MDFILAVGVCLGHGFCIRDSSVNLLEAPHPPKVVLYCTNIVSKYGKKDYSTILYFVWSSINVV
ncbi:hypothetical protein BC670_0206 [Flavobacterium branchiophilum]|uniref:Uncharacterized protein n=1 Tax=Flavobacterium branchiophilum TaxID=55197 RepID=A0A543G035_9FLAO|nr:hypothetical protein BC670_0206 [Flavobacterium branchiophilum]